jgi:hypothetical protein
MPAPTGQQVQRASHVKNSLDDFGVDSIKEAQVVVKENDFIPSWSSTQISGLSCW